MNEWLSCQPLGVTILFKRNFKEDGFIVAPDKMQKVRNCKIVSCYGEDVSDKQRETLNKKGKYIHAVTDGYEFQTLVFLPTEKSDKTDADIYELIGY